MAVEQSRESVANALAGALVIADLGDTKQVAGFAIEVSRVAAWAAEAKDEVGIALAHEIEVLLGHVTSNETSPAEATSLIGELISVMLDAPTGAPATDNAPIVLPEEGNVYAQDATVIKEFIAGAREQLDEAEALLSACATGESIEVDALFRCFHTLKGIASFLSLNDMATTAHNVETGLETVRSGACEMEEGAIVTALKAVDEMRRIVDDVEHKASKSKHAKRTTTTARSAETVRVDASRLEDLLDAIGEMVVAESEVAVAVQRAGDETATRSLERLARITRDMQATATSLRMVSLSPTFRKMSRVVRDMIASSGKRVELTISGGETELDRTIVEGIADPLVHLLRNAIDHGIESSAARLAAGKPETGSIILRAFHRGGSVHVEIADDGRGIDLDKLLAKAAAMGIDTDRDHALELIYRPGFSTAEAVTEISGRGVGLDAVATAVTALRGQFDVQSTLGVGTTFSIRLPLTLAVIDGIVLRAGDERYIVPTEFVERTLSVSEGQTVSAAGRGTVLVLPDGKLAVFPITEPMGGTLETGRAAVILVDGDSRFALLVDEVIGQQSLVIKALSGPVTQAAGVTGAALMGDGKAALVIDPFGIAKAMRGGW